MDRFVFREASSFQTRNLSVSYFYNRPCKHSAQTSSMHKNNDKMNGMPYSDRRTCSLCHWSSLLRLRKKIKQQSYFCHKPYSHHPSRRSHCHRRLLLLHLFEAIFCQPREKIISPHFLPRRTKVGYLWFFAVGFRSCTPLFEFKDIVPNKLINHI